MSSLFPSLGLRRASRGDELLARRGSKSTSTLAESELNKKVMQAQKSAVKANKGTIKLLMLGAGGSGKSKGARHGRCTCEAKNDHH